MSIGQDLGPNAGITHPMAGRVEHPLPEDKGLLIRGPLLILVFSSK